MRKIACITFVALVGCGPSTSEFIDAGGGGGGGGSDGGGGGGGGGGNEFADAAPAEPCDKMDIVFVIDDSGSMAEEQDNLADNFPQFATVINDYMTENGNLLDYRIAITTTGRDVDWTVDLGIGFPLTFNEDGANGAFLTGSACDMPRSWLERTDSDVSGSFSCVARGLGTGGPTYEMPLLALEWALSDRIDDGTNAGFLREDALLAVVVLTDEDDCSREDNDFTVTSDSCNPPLPETVPLEHYASFLDTVKGDRGRWAIAVTAGPSSCETQWGEAIEARRLKQFVSDAGDNAVFSSICEADLSGALSEALDTFESACENFPPIP